jgi:hypothetical protein
LIEARNLSIERNNAERILILDGDEYISRDCIMSIKKFNANEKAD